MPDYLDVKPEQLRRSAEEQHLAAVNIRKWGEIPHEWLAKFSSGYGTIADPLRASLVAYYNRRHERAERLAANHERARDNLLAAADRFEGKDEAGAHQIVRTSGDDGRVPSGGPAQGAPPGPAGTGASLPNVNGIPPGQPADPDISGTPNGTGRSGQVFGSPAASAPQTYGGPVPAETLPSIGDSYVPVGPVEPPAGTYVPVQSSAGVYVPGGVDAPGYTSNTVNGAAGVTGGGTSALPGPGPGSFAAVVPDGVGVVSHKPAPLGTGPFAAAVHVAEGRRTLPSLVVGELQADDLVLGRTLLAATLAATADSAAGLEWAVMVVRSHGGPIVLLTSTEGRGWLPSGLFLPSEVRLPWRWDSIFDSAVREELSAMEGGADPARTLAEFGARFRDIRRVRISALVSSAAISDDLRAAIGDDAAMEGQVSAGESAVDLASPGVGLCDRLALAGSDELLRQAVTVPEKDIRATCLELARVANAQVCAAVAGVDGETVARRSRRQQILDALHAGLPVPASWWDRMRADDNATAAALRQQGADLSGVSVGVAPPNVPGVQAMRDMVFERRADELLLLLSRAGEPDRQTLRDALYTYGQIAEHPLLPVAAAETTRTGAEVPDIAATHRGSPGVHGVGTTVLGGGPPPMVELLNSPAGSEGSSEQRRA